MPLLRTTDQTLTCICVIFNSEAPMINEYHMIVLKLLNTCSITVIKLWTYGSHVLNWIKGIGFLNDTLTIKTRDLENCERFRTLIKTIVLGELRKNNTLINIIVAAKLVTQIELIWILSLLCISKIWNMCICFSGKILVKTHDLLPTFLGLWHPINDKMTNLK